MNNGLLYRVSQVLGLGKHSEAKQLENSVFWVTVLQSIFFCCIIFCLLIGGDFVNPNKITIFIVLILAIPTYLLNNYYIVIARVNSSFRLIGFINIITSVMLFFFTALAAIYAERSKVVELMLSAIVICSLLSVLIYSQYYKVMDKPSICLSQIASLLKIGFPLTILPLLYILFLSIDRWLLIKSLSPVEFGYYSFGVAIGGMILILPNTFGTVLFTKLVKNYSHEKSKINNSSILMFSVRICSLLMSILAGTITLFLPLVLEKFFYDYHLGVVTIIIISTAYCLLFPLPIVSTYLIAIEKKKTLLKILGLFIFSIFSILIIVREYENSHINASVIFLVYLVFSLTLVITLIRSVDCPKTFNNMFKVYGSFMIMLIYSAINYGYALEFWPSTLLFSFATILAIAFHHKDCLILISYLKNREVVI